MGNNQSDGTMTRYEYRRMQQRCVKCNTRDARTMSGKSRCAECAEKASESASKYLRDHRQQVMNYRKGWRQKMRETGMCPRCGKRPAESAGGWCRYCLDKKKKSDRAHRALQGAVPNDKVSALGLCWRCRRNPATEGSGYCVECLEWWESVRNKGKKNEDFTK